jgi:drug/metabolite transporter (DMT)-like permease
MRDRRLEIAAASTLRSAGDSRIGCAPVAGREGDDVGAGELFSLASAATWAVGVILYRQLGTSLAPLPLNFMKNLVVLGLLLPTLPLLHGFTLPDMPLADVALSLASGALGIAIADTLYFAALNTLGAARMGVIGNAYSPFVILLSFLFLGERLNAWQVAGFALVSSGVWLVTRSPAPVVEGPPESPVPVAGVGDAMPRRKGTGGFSLHETSPVPFFRLRGALLGLLAVALMAAAVVMVKRVLEQQPLAWVTWWRLVGALLAMLLLAAARGELRALLPSGALGRWRRLLLAAFVGQYLAMLLWLAGYKFTQASVAAILNETSSAFIVLLAWAWLREPLHRRALAGVGLTLGGVALMLGG